jgi:hypothetical protein
MEIYMRCSTVAQLSLVTTLSVISLAACGGQSPAPQRSAPAPEQNSPQSSERPANPSPLAGATPAPGSERFDPDPHPELAHLTQVTVDLLEEGIKTYVQAETARQGGVFPVSDPEQHTSLGLTLMTVHRERLSKLADERYFACADFKGRDGHTYDVDVFMRRESTGLTPTDVIVHKQDGRPRFNWVEQNGIWSQVPVVTP